MASVIVKGMLVYVGVCPAAEVLRGSSTFSPCPLYSVGQGSVHISLGDITPACMDLSFTSQVRGWTTNLGF